MNELAIKLAELLEITVDAAIDLYPVLREQYVVYKVTAVVEGWAFFLAIVTLVLVSYLWDASYSELKEKKEDIRIRYNDSEEEENKKRNDFKRYELEILENNKRYIKKYGYVAALIVLGIILIIFRYVYATDLLMILQFL